ncbi:MAG: spermidine synthase [Cellvibrionaceae bacterium]
MAIIWCHERTISQQDGSRIKKSYQVRSAGNSLRLYTNGVFHSQYNPLYPIGGTIWDLLALPAIYSTHKIKRVLLLGVGGGAVIQQLKSLIDCEEIVGIELDPIHIKIAKKYFKVTAKKNNISKSRDKNRNQNKKKPCKVTLHCADAIKWLKEYRGKKFDLIIDDLFFEEEGVPQRAVAADSQWCGLIAKHCHTSERL